MFSSFREFTASSHTRGAYTRGGLTTWLKTNLVIVTGTLGIPDRIARSLKSLLIIFERMDSRCWTNERAESTCMPSEVIKGTQGKPPMDSGGSGSWMFRILDFSREIVKGKKHLRTSGRR